MQQFGNVYPISFEIDSEIENQFIDKYADKIAELLIKYYNTISDENTAYISKMVSHNIKTELIIEADIF